MGEEEKKGLTTGMNRRTFLAAGVLSVGSVATGAVSLRGIGLAKTPRQSQGVVWPDPELCIGCLMCEEACADWHASQRLSAMPRIRILRTETGKVNPEVVGFAGGISFQQSPCKQCAEPRCYAVCPAEAIKLDAETGSRYIDEQICTACGKCEEACPYDTKGVLQSTTAKTNMKRVFFDKVKKVYTKCDLCRGRAGGPACIDRCPINGLIKAGRIKSNSLCLELKPSTRQAMDQIL